MDADPVIRGCRPTRHLNSPHDEVPPLDGRIPALQITLRPGDLDRSPRSRGTPASACRCGRLSEPADAPPARRGCRSNPLRPARRTCRHGSEFIEGAREQGFVLPPDVRDWLADDHLAWLVIDSVAELACRRFIVPTAPKAMAMAARPTSRRRWSRFALRLRDQAALLASDRAPLPSGRRLACDHRQPDLRSRHGRALCLPPRRGARRPLRRGARALHPGGACEARRGGDRRHPDRGLREPAGKPRVRADSARDPRRGEGNRRGRGRALRRSARRRAPRRAAHTGGPARVLSPGARRASPRAIGAAARRGA